MNQVPVWAVLDYTETRTIARELVLAKVSILGPEYLEDQLIGGHSYDPRSAGRQNVLEHTLIEDEVTLAHNFEHSGEPAVSEATTPIPLTPTQALLNKHQILQSISSLSSQFGAKIVDVSTNSVIVEMTGKTARVDAFLALLKPFGVLESARTGTSGDSALSELQSH
jgi:acetolactate synthase-1/3 small subunit